MGDYSIWILEFAYTTHFPKSSVIYGAHNEGTLKLPYAYVLIKGRGQVAMVDVGYDNVAYSKILTERFAIENWHSPRDVLKECGVTPEEVQHIFITHAHFDHMGGIELFPNATFYIQEKELSKWVWAMALDRRLRWLMSAIDPQDIMRVVDLARQNRLVCIDGACEEVLPGIDIFPAYDSHTAGSQYLVVRNDGQRNSADNWVLAGDLVYQVENLVGYDPQDPCYLPVGFAQGSQTNLLLATHEMVGKVGGDTKRVIAVHEARLKDMFPSRLTAEGLQIIEVALGEGQKSCVR